MSSQTAIVILNWNGKKLLEEFLLSVIEHSGNTQIVVADNCSSDDSISFVQQHYPSVTIIKNDHNYGFAKGYNEALKHVDAEFYVLLNNDVEVSQNWLTPLEDALNNDHTIAGCQPLILAQQRPSHFEHAGAAGGFIDVNYFPFCRGRIFDAVEENNNQYNSDIDIFWASGACLMIRAELFHQAGGFDEDFFAHMEEIDLCWRIKRLGYTFKAIGSSTVYHVGGGTLNYQSPRKTYLNFRNNLLMITKNHQGILFFKIFIRLCLDGIAALQFLVTGKFQHFFAVFKAHMAYYAQLPKTLAKRSTLKKTATEYNASGYFGGSILWNHFIKKVSKSSDLNQRLFKK